MLSFLFFSPPLYLILNDGVTSYNMAIGETGFGKGRLRGSLAGQTT